jgi:hypothetical protein
MEFVMKQNKMEPNKNRSDVADGFDAVDHNDHPGAAPATSWLHPRVYAILIVFAAWFALAVWGFAGSGITDYLLVIISGFIFVVVALVSILSQVGGGAAGDAAKTADRPLSFRAWAAGDFDTWQERLSGAQAALMILLPIAAAAIGMTAFAIVFHFAERGV